MPIPLYPAVSLRGVPDVPYHRPEEVRGLPDKSVRRGKMRERVPGHGERQGLSQHLIHPDRTQLVLYLDLLAIFNSLLLAVERKHVLCPPETNPNVGAADVLHLSGLHARLAGQPQEVVDECAASTL